MNTKQRSTKILMLPWLAHGHISPFLDLAKKLTARNFTTYFCTTPINIVSIKPKLSEKYSVSIKFVELHLPNLPELPPHYHTTNGLPPHLMKTLKLAFDLSSPTFSNLLKNLNPDLLIYDFLQPWAPTLALSQNITPVAFISSSCVMTSFVIHYFKNPSVKFPFPSIYLEDYEIINFINLLESSSNNIKDKERLQKCIEKSSKIILIKTMQEIEAEYISYLNVLTNKKVLPVGSLVHENSNKEDEEGELIIRWLNEKERSSTVFVSFGTECFLSNEEIKEIAYGLELSEVNFIWVLRFSVGESNIKVEDTLPNGFSERVGEKGIVVKGWAPQLRILKNYSIGGFVSHCGWSSVMESLKFGVPIIAMPMHLDQPVNARLVEEVGVGLEVKRDMNGNIERDEVARVIREVLVEKSGENVRRKSSELRDKIRNKGDEEIDGMVEELVKLVGR